MKRYHFILSIILFLLFISCSEDFTLNAPNEDTYVLNCILNNENAAQYAVVSKNIYTPNGTPPTSNYIIENIKGADVKIYCNDSVFVMRDTTIQITESGKETNINCYYMNNFKLKPGLNFRIEASIPGGKLLKSTIDVPKILFEYYEINFPGSAIPDYNWSWMFDNNYIKNIINFPQIEICYKKIEEGKLIDKKKLVKLLYYPYASGGSPYSPGVTFSYNDFCYTNKNEIEIAMREISKDDPNKNNYIINKVIFSVIGLDAGLSLYYSVCNTYFEDFTIKLRPADFTNIEGGKGIFGSYFKHSRFLNVDKHYIKDFGYQYDPS